MWKWFRRLGYLFGLLLLVCGALYAAAFRAMGDDPSGEALAIVERSPQYRDGAFFNLLPRVDGPFDEMMGRWLFGGSEHRTPDEPIRPEHPEVSDQRILGLRATWLGHSTILLEIGGARVLIDPVWGERASPLSFLGPERWYAPPLPLDELPEIDAIVISHDHYDHLDYPTVTALAARPITWFVPLGVGSHLRYWGVAPERIVELDWWGSKTVGSVTITCTPARHFSGRGFSQNSTLWAGWAIASSEHRVFYSGDTAMFPGFVEIGDRLGPFDLAMVEVGAYDALWSDVHLGPEQAVRAARLVRAKTLLPVHWGLFDLALHAWTEPMERVLVAAKREGMRVLTPPPGGSVEPTLSSTVVKWWPDLPYRTFEEAPANSTSVDELNGERYAPPWPN